MNKHDQQMATQVEVPEVDEPTVITEEERQMYMFAMSMIVPFNDTLMELAQRDEPLFIAPPYNLSYMVN